MQKTQIKELLIENSLIEYEQQSMPTYLDFPSHFEQQIPDTVNVSFGECVRSAFPLCGK